MFITVHEVPGSRLQTLTGIALARRVRVRKQFTTIAFSRSGKRYFCSERSGGGVADSINKGHTHTHHPTHTGYTRTRSHKCVHTHYCGCMRTYRYVCWLQCVTEVVKIDLLVCQVLSVYLIHSTSVQWPQTSATAEHSKNISKLVWVSPTNGWESIQTVLPLFHPQLQNKFIMMRLLYVFVV